MNPSSKLEAALESTGLNQEQKDKIRDAYKEDLRRQTDNIGDMIDAFKEKLNKNNTEALKKTRKEVTKQMWNNNRIDLENEKEKLEATDELYDDAVSLVLDQRTASVSMLQRRFRIGYSRAARIVDQMEARGVVGPPEGSKPRQVLLSRAEVERY